MTRQIQGGTVGNRVSIFLRNFEIVFTSAHQDYLIVRKTTSH